MGDSHHPRQNGPRGCGNRVIWEGQALSNPQPYPAIATKIGWQGTVHDDCDVSVTGPAGGAPPAPPPNVL